MRKLRRALTNCVHEMIKENQKLLNYLNILSDGIILYVMLPIAFWVRFELLQNGVVTVPLAQYMALGLFLVAGFLFTYAAVGLYRSFRKERLGGELVKLWQASALDMVVLLSLFFLQRDFDYSRLMLAIFMCLGAGTLSIKRIALRLLLRRMRKQGYNIKHILIVGAGAAAAEYLQAIRSEKELGYRASGYVADAMSDVMTDIKWLGGFDQLEKLLETQRPDEVVSAVEFKDLHQTAQIIYACEKTGTKLSVIPFYAEYMTSRPQFDELAGIPLMNLRYIPLDNWLNAFCKRMMDIVGSAGLILLTSPIMLVCAVGVRLSSPGPIIFRQKRVGLNKKPFDMYKFRSMRVNSSSDTGWSADKDNRKTSFGAVLRKFSLDEFPQFFNVLKGDMSLIGPRPEVPFHVEHFKEEIPLYMVKHQVRPGITGWAQVNGYRGDTSIEKRIEHDIYYIEHWSIWFDLKILLITLFGRKFINSEKLS